MNCPYQYYQNEDEYYARLFCSLDSQYCIYSKRCDKVYKYISNDNQKECYKYIMEKQREIPVGSYYVQTTRLNKWGKLYIYVVINDKVERIETNFKSLEQNYVYLKENLDKDYEVSLTPFVEKKAPKTRKSID